jgi:Tfp pilus assembly protein PilF
MQKNWAAAEPEYVEAIRLEPSNASRHNGLGDLFYGQKRWAEAERAYVEAVRLAPARADLHSNLGLALEMQMKFDAAAAEYREAVRLEPQNPIHQQRLDALLRHNAASVGPDAPTK